MAKNYLLALFIFFGLYTQAQELAQGPPPPSGCSPFGVIDSDNDGYASFDIDWIKTVYIPGRALYDFNYNLSGYVIQFYPTLNDASAETNEITTSTYTNVVTPEQHAAARLTYVGPGPEYNQFFLDAYVGNCIILTPLPPDGDYDNDGISNANEDANANGNLNDDDSDGDWLGDYAQPNPLKNQGFAQSHFSITPNPASGIINIEMANHKYDLTIFDLTGKQVLAISNTTQKSVDISNIKTGIYLVKINCGKENFQQKLVIK